MAGPLALSLSDASTQKEDHRRQAAQLAGLHPASARRIPRQADAKAVAATAVETFKLDGERRKRLALRAEE
jgi:hypothetical protein